MKSASDKIILADFFEAFVAVIIAVCIALIIDKMLLH